MIRKHIKIFTLLCDNLCLRIAYGLVSVSVMSNIAVITDMRWGLDVGATNTAVTATAIAGIAKITNHFDFLETIFIRYLPSKNKK